jgi:hypothetical protein
MHTGKPKRKPQNGSDQKIVIGRAVSSNAVGKSLRVRCPKKKDDFRSSAGNFKNGDETGHFEMA